MNSIDIIFCLGLALILICGTAKSVINQRANVQEWLILACTNAEKELGNGTGALKLRTVYEEFAKLYPIFSKFVKFDTFSEWVETALCEMREMLEKNKYIGNYVKGAE